MLDYIPSFLTLLLVLCVLLTKPLTTKKPSSVCRRLGNSQHFFSVCSMFRHRNAMPVTDPADLNRARGKVLLFTNQDVMTLLAHVLSNQHAFFAGVSKEWRNAWGDLPKVTQAVSSDTYVSQLRCSFDGGARKRPKLCEHIAEHCDVEILLYDHASGCGAHLNACFNAARAREACNDSVGTRQQMGLAQGPLQSCCGGRKSAYSQVATRQ